MTKIQKQGELLQVLEDVDLDEPFDYESPVRELLDPVFVDCAEVVELVVDTELLIETLTSQILNACPAQVDAYHAHFVSVIES